MNGIGHSVKGYPSGGVHLSTGDEFPDSPCGSGEVGYIEYPGLDTGTHDINKVTCLACLAALSRCGRAAKARLSELSLPLRQGRAEVHRRRRLGSCEEMREARKRIGEVDHRPELIGPGNGPHGTMSSNLSGSVRQKSSMSSGVKARGSRPPKVQPLEP